MRIFGLIGKSLSHSFSPKYFNEKFEREAIPDAKYQLFELERIELVKDLLMSEIRGLNVTIPYKKLVIPFLDEVDDIAKQIESVNTISIQDGRSFGFNTDWIGFRDSLKPLLSRGDRKALVLGTGGSSSAVCFALSKLDIEVKLVSRNPKQGQLSYPGLSEVFHDYQIIVNTTPLGMFPRVEDMPPIPYDRLSSEQLLFDLVYNPQATRFLEMGIAKGCRVKNGLEMLELQAEASWAIWNR